MINKNILIYEANKYYLKSAHNRYQGFPPFKCIILLNTDIKAGTPITRGYC